MRIRGLLLLALALALPEARAAILAESTFDAGNDGWRIGQFFF